MYKYEMHCHTKESSKCGKISGAEMADFYKDMGYTGLIISDHFFNGNTAVPKDLPWEERIEQFCKGYEVAKARGDKIGIDVFLAWENSYRGNDFLTYGLDKKWLLEHPYCDTLPVKEYLCLVKKSGGYSVQAHPYREADYVDMIRLLPRNVDAVETVNACNTDFENKMADIYATEYGLTKVCGTDNHVGKRDRLSALELEFRANSILDIISAIKDGNYKISLYETN
ncbi:MAG: histidinol phosphatase [Clostridia bacterium]|nr:histidinol phosphatase [Clostridia bacterium]